jgi:uroporphyrinogen-III synthase
MRIIVTRPEPQATQWVELLRQRGVDAVAMPLLRIVAADLPPAMAQEARHKLPTYQLVMFVSPNAVGHFFSNVMPGLRWPAGPIAAATGPGTVAALHAAGVPAEAIAAPAADAAQFDSRALWNELREHDWRGARALIVRGEEGREWLADTLRSAGAGVDLLDAYRRAPPLWDADQLALLDAALAQPDAHVWLFSSSQSIGHLVPRLREPGCTPPWHRMQALATHPRIEQAARAAGFAQVRCVAPTVEAVVESVIAPT